MELFFWWVGAQSGRWGHLGRGRTQARQHDREHTALARLAGHGDAPAMQVHRSFDDGQAQPRARDVANVGGSVEALEQARQIILRDADTHVSDGQGKFPFTAINIEQHHTAWRRVLDCIGEQVAKYVAHQGVVELGLARLPAHG